MLKKLMLVVFISSLMAGHTVYAQDQQTEDLRVDSEAENVVADENAQSLNEIKTDNEKTVTDKKSLQKMVIHLKHQNDGLMDKIKREKAKSVALRDERNKVQAEAAKLEKQSNKMQTEVAVLKEGNESTQKRIDGTKYRIKIANQEIAKLKADQKALAKKKAMLEKSLAKLKAQEKAKAAQKKALHQAKAKSKKLKLNKA